MKRVNIGLVILLMVMAIDLSAAQAETLYKWIDSQGRISYHDQPPPADSNFRVEEKVVNGSRRPRQEDTLAKVVEKYPVVLYSVPDCGSCDLARLYLEKRKVPFSEQNLNTSAELQQTLKKKIGSLSAPTIMIGDKVMKGYVESVLEGQLDDAGYPKVEAAEATSQESTEKDKSSAPDDSSPPRPSRSY